MGEDRPTMSKQEVFSTTKSLLEEKPEYKGAIKQIFQDMEKEEPPYKAKIDHIGVNLGRLAYLKRKKILFKPIDTNSYKVWEFTNRKAVKKALQRVRKQQKVVENQKEDRKSYNSFRKTSLSRETRKEFQELTQEHDMLNYWAPYLNPNLSNMLLQKKAILLSLASLNDFQGKRGRINVLLYGEGGTGKSDLLEWSAEKIGHGQCLGPRSSEVGLTGDARGDSVTLGVLPQEHGGFACVDEVEKFSKKDRGGLYKSMANGVVPINVGEHRERFPAETRVLAACNKKDSLSEPLRTRFDFKLECKKPVKKEGKKIVRDIVMGWRKENPKYAGSRLRKYLKWVREFTPSITSHAQEKLAKAMEKYVEEHGRERIQPRNYERFLRIIFTIARMNHRDVEIQNGRLPDFERALELCPDAHPIRIEITS